MILNNHLLIYITIFFFFFNDTATTEIYTLSLHDALPISPSHRSPGVRGRARHRRASARARMLDPAPPSEAHRGVDRKSTRLNSSHGYISYAVFCLKKKKNKNIGMKIQSPIRDLFTIDTYS